MNVQCLQSTFRGEIGLFNACYGPDTNTCRFVYTVQELVFVGSLPYHTCGDRIYRMDPESLEVTCKIFKDIQGAINGHGRNVFIFRLTEAFSKANIRSFPG